MVYKPGNSEPKVESLIETDSAIEMKSKTKFLMNIFYSLAEEFPRNYFSNTLVIEHIYMEKLHIIYCIICDVKI